MILVLGAFDGFHRGHQSLFQAASALARERNDTWGMCTFSPHPGLVLYPAGCRLLFDEEEKSAIVRYLQIPNVIRISFDLALAALDPQSFLKNLFSLRGISGLVVGENFHFGAGKTGDSKLLQESCERQGVLFRVLPRICIHNRPVSSSAIRRLVFGGNLEGAREWLGYPFFLLGPVVRGNGRGRTLGYPTANISLPHWKVLPPEGVYAAYALIRGTREVRLCALSIGMNPTFDDVGERRIEAHILEFDESFYGKEMVVAPFRHLRGSVRFSGSDDLKRQIGSDIESVSQFGGMNHNDNPHFAFISNLSGTFEMSPPVSSPGESLAYDAISDFFVRRNSQ